MKLTTIPYRTYERGLPQEGNYMLGQMIHGNVIVYQAFNDGIADYAIQHQKFGGPNYSFSRMTWIKPNFLWMMYRSGWAQKENQNRILAIEITFDGFSELLAQGVLSSYDSSLGSNESWKADLNSSDVRIQWDPDHNPQGDKLKRRAVQIGIKGDVLKKFDEQYLISVTDITSFVKEQKQNLDRNEDAFFVIDEKIIPVRESIRQKFEIPETFISPYIQNLIRQFESSGEINDQDFEKFLSETGNTAERNQMVDYIKNYHHIEFSRHLLKKAIVYRLDEDCPVDCMCEDLLMFSYFVSKNGTAMDFDLVMEAKLADFDTWCGFDGEMVFYTFGFEKTQQYLKENVEKFSQKTVDYFLGFTEQYLNEEIHGRAFWYFG